MQISKHLTVEKGTKNLAKQVMVNGFTLMTMSRPRWEKNTDGNCLYEAGRFRSTAKIL